MKLGSLLAAAIRSLHGRPFPGGASNRESNKLGCYITMYLPTARSVVLRRRNQTIIDLLGNVFIHNAARSNLSPQMAKPCKERFFLCPLVFAGNMFCTSLCFQNSRYILHSLHSLHTLHKRHHRVSHINYKAFRRRLYYVQNHQPTRWPSIFPAWSH